MHHEPPEPDWERAEISSLLKEAKTLRSQKEQLEAQIAQAEDANASLQSWGALSRVSTALANENSSFSQRPSPLKAEEVYDDEDRSEVLFASHQTLQLDLEILRGRLAEAEAGCSREDEETMALEVREDQAKELARLLRELQALQGHVDKKTSELMALNKENGEQALLALTTDRAKLQEESDALKEEMLAAEALPKLARKQQVVQEAQRAQRGLQEARDLWHAQVNISRSALKVEENELAKLSGCREALHLALLEGRRASVDLCGRVAQLRSEYGRLLNWQARSAQSDADPFGLEATAASLRRRIQSQEEELQELRRQDAEEQVATVTANLQRKRAEEALALGALQAKTAAELRAFEVCISHLQRLGREMTQEAASLQLQRQRELSLISALRSELQKSGKAASGPRRSTSAPQLRLHGDPERPALARSGITSKKAPKKVSVRIQRPAVHQA